MSYRKITAKSPTNPRPQADHSCESRNLIATLSFVAVLLPLSRPFLRRQESHSVVYTNNGKIAHKSPSPSRPFLRRQESHKHGWHRRLNFAALPLVKMRFLPSQEWSGGVRECVCGFWRLLAAMMDNWRIRP